MNFCLDVFVVHITILHLLYIYMQKAPAFQLYPYICDKYKAVTEENVSNYLRECIPCLALFICEFKSSFFILKISFPLFLMKNVGKTTYLWLMWERMHKRKIEGTVLIFLFHHLIQVTSMGTNSQDLRKNQCMFVQRQYIYF